MASPYRPVITTRTVYSLGVPEGGKDYAFGDAFPHEALFDQLHGVSFEKGCYVGQEVVSRMEHRGTARKRVVPVVAEALPATGTEITAGDQLIGTLGSSAGKRWLALLRLDRAAEMKTKGADLIAGPVVSNRAAAMGQVRPRAGRSPLAGTGCGAAAAANWPKASAACAAYITEGPAPMYTAMPSVSITSSLLAPCSIAALAWNAMQSSQRVATPMRVRSIPWSWYRGRPASTRPVRSLKTPSSRRRRHRGDL